MNNLMIFAKRQVTYKRGEELCTGSQYLHYTKDPPILDSCLPLIEKNPANIEAYLQCVEHNSEYGDERCELVGKIRNWISVVKDEGYEVYGVLAPPYKGVTE